MANWTDWGFLEPFEAGGDLHAPIVEPPGVTRKQAKGPPGGHDAARAELTAAALGISTEEAQRLQAGMFSAMPTTRGFIDRLRQIGETPASSSPGRPGPADPGNPRPAHGGVYRP